MRENTATLKDPDETVFPLHITLKHEDNSEEIFFLYRHGSFNVVYLNENSTFILKISKNYFDSLSEIDTECALLTDSPERLTALWNTHTLPLLEKIANDEMLDEAASIRQQARVCFPIANGQVLKGSLYPYIEQDKNNEHHVFLTEDQLNTFILETYRGHPLLNIPGGRIMVDTMISNVICFHGRPIPIDLGNFFALNLAKKLHREFSEASLTAWENNLSFSSEKKGFDRISDYRSWYIERLIYIKKTPSVKRHEFLSTYILLSAMIYLSMKKPAYLDLFCLQWNPKIKEICAFLFLSDDFNESNSDLLMKIFFPGLNGLDKEAMNALIESNFPDISACSFYEDAPTLSYSDIIEKLSFENELQKKFLAIKVSLGNIADQATKPESILKTGFFSTFNDPSLADEKRIIISLNDALQKADHVQHLKLITLPSLPLKVRDILKKYIDELKEIQDLLAGDICFQSVGP